MATRCEVLETAAKLSLQLEAYRIPDSFEATGKDWQVVDKVRDEYTNYRQLLGALDDCRMGEQVTKTGRSGHDCAREMLEVEARALARRVYRSWHARRNKVTAGAHGGKLS